MNRFGGVDRSSFSGVRGRNSESGSKIPTNRRQTGLHAYQAAGDNYGGQQRKTSISQRLSFTTTPRSSSVPSRDSVAGRSSQIKRTPSASRIDGSKDPRPVGEKAFKTKQIMNLLQFLTTYGYSHQISPKLLQTPTSKDFSRIFEFIYGFLAKNYRIPPKIEEEVPKVLKNLGYPFTISKTTMYSVGSAHAWPAILAGLSWLREKVEMYFYFNENALMILLPTASPDSFDHDSENKIYFEYLYSSYNDSLAGIDSGRERDDELVNTLRMNIDLEQRIEENQRLRAELQQLSSNSDELSQLKYKLHATSNDCEQVMKYNEQVDERIAASEKILPQIYEGVKTKEQEIASTITLNADRRKTISNQAVSQDDVKLINQKQTELRRQVAQEKRLMDQLEEEIGRGQIGLSRLWEKLTDKYFEFCSIYSKVTLNTEFEIDICPPASDIAAVQQFLQEARENQKHLDEKKNNEKLTLQTQITQLLDSRDKLAEAIREEHETIILCERDLNSCDRKIEVTQEIIKVKLDKLKVEYEERQQEINAERLKKQMTSDELQRTIKQEKMNFERKQQELSKELNDRSEEFLAYCEQWSEYKKIVEDWLNNMVADNKKFWEEINQKLGLNQITDIEKRTAELSL